MFKSVAELRVELLVQSLNIILRKTTRQTAQAREPNSRYTVESTGKELSWLTVVRWHGCDWSNATSDPPSNCLWLVERVFCPHPSSITLVPHTSPQTENVTVWSTGYRTMVHLHCKWHVCGFSFLLLFFFCQANHIYFRKSIWILYMMTAIFLLNFV